MENNFYEHYNPLMNSFRISPLENNILIYSQQGTERQIEREEKYCNKSFYWPWNLLLFSKPTYYFVKRMH